MSNSRKHLSLVKYLGLGLGSGNLKRVGVPTMGVASKVKTFMICLGWAEAPTLSTVTRHGLAGWDRVLFLTPDWDDRGVVETISSLSGVIRRIDGRISVERFKVPLRSVDEAVVAIARRIRVEASEGRRIILNLSGGMRILVVESLLGAIFSGVRDILVEVQFEDKSMVVEVPNLWGLIPSPEDPSIKLLKELSSKEKLMLNIRKLSQNCNLPLTTTHRWLKKLEKQGLIKLEKTGKEIIPKPTTKGKIITLITT